MNGPTVEVALEWAGELRFAGRSGDARFQLDSGGKAGLSPVQAVAAGLAGCMAIDVVHILTRGRLPLQSLSAHLTAERAPTDPKRIVAVLLRFTVTGDVAPDKVERAIALSREKYCSVWHSLRQDIELETSFAIVPPSP